MNKKPNIRTHSMTMRSNAESDPTAMISTSFFDIKEPDNVLDALGKTQRVTAMKEELEALHRNETWTLAPRTPEMNVVGSRWVFKPS